LPGTWGAVFYEFAKIMPLPRHGKVPFGPFQTEFSAEILTNLQKYQMSTLCHSREDGKSKINVHNPVFYLLMMVWISACAGMTFFVISVQIGSLSQAIK